MTSRKPAASGLADLRALLQLAAGIARFIGIGVGITVPAPRLIDLGSGLGGDLTLDWLIRHVPCPSQWVRLRFISRVSRFRVTGKANLDCNTRSLYTPRYHLLRGQAAGTFAHILRLRRRRPCDVKERS